MSRRYSPLVVLGLVFFLLCSLLCSQLGSIPPSPARAGALRAPQACGGLFISEYFEGGGSNNAALEIFNGTGAPVAFNASDKIHTFFGGLSTPSVFSFPEMILGSGDVFVVAHTKSNAAVLAEADVTTNQINHSGDDAIALVKDGVVIDVIGQIGVDPGYQWGTELVSTADNTLRRKSNVFAGDPDGSDLFDPAKEWDGFEMDDASGLGFHTADCLAADAPPAVTGVLPSNMTDEVAYDANLQVTFSEPVNVPGAWFDITCSVSGAHTAAVSGGPKVFTLDPDENFASGDVCTVRIIHPQVTDQDGTADMMTAEYSWRFITHLRIHDLQGAGHFTPYHDWIVKDIPGVVTRLTSNGFYMQDESPDGKDATSEAIYVNKGSSPSVKVGDRVEVTGKVYEYYPDGIDSGNLSTTWLLIPTIKVLASDVPLPAPVTIGAGGRIPPDQIIEDDSSGNVELQTSFDPENDGIDFYESLEGMLVQVKNARVVGATDLNASSSDQQIVVVGDEGSFSSGFSPRGGLVVRPVDFNPERIFLEAKAPNFPQVGVGDIADGSISGVIDYTDGSYKLLPKLPLPSFLPGGLLPETTQLDGSRQQLRVATMNVENLDPSLLDGEDDTARFAALANQVVHHLHSPEIIGLQEIQDDTGGRNDGVVTASATYTALIQAIQAAGGPTYDYREIAPENNQDGGQTGGNIRVAFLFRTDRGLSFIDRPGGTATLGATVQEIDGKPALTYSPGRIDPTHSAFDDSRKPLAGEFLYNGTRLFLIVNHLNSKGEDDPLFGRSQPPVLGSEPQRIAQAQVINDFVDSLLALDPNANVIVLGDLNDFEFSTPLQTLMGEDDASHVLTDTLYLLPETERSTYLYQGNLQALDHILLSPNLLSTAAPEVDVVHFNAEFPEPMRASDHDPVVVGLTLAPLGAADFGDLPAQYRQAWHTPSGLYLGSLLTNDAAFSAGSDDASDDGVMRGPGSAVGGQWQAGPEGGSLDVTPSGPGAGYVYAWIDWNGDGDFEDAGEDIIQEALIEDAANLPFDIPDGMFAGAALSPTLHARIRFYDDHPGPIFSPYGAGASGEVEDYVWTFTPTAVTLTSLAAGPSVHPAAAAWIGGLAALGLLLLGGLFLSLRNRQSRGQGPDRG